MRCRMTQRAQRAAHLACDGTAAEEGHQLYASCIRLATNCQTLSLSGRARYRRLLPVRLLAEDNRLYVTAVNTVSAYRTLDTVSTARFTSLGVPGKSCRLCHFCRFNLALASEHDAMAAAFPPLATNLRTL